VNYLSLKRQSVSIVEEIIVGKESMRKKELVIS
jgi:hypothetical protein